MQSVFLDLKFLNNLDFFSKTSYFIKNIFRDFAIFFLFSLCALNFLIISKGLATLVLTTYGCCHQILEIKDWVRHLLVMN